MALFRRKSRKKCDDSWKTKWLFIMNISTIFTSAYGHLKMALLRIFCTVIVPNYSTGAFVINFPVFGFSNFYVRAKLGSIKKFIIFSELMFICIQAPPLFSNWKFPFRICRWQCWNTRWLFNGEVNKKNSKWCFHFQLSNFSLHRQLILIVGVLVRDFM